MNRLREKLREMDPELYGALGRSWEIALNEWLPALAIGKTDSFNSYPHLRNLEKYLDDIILGYEDHPTDKPPDLGLSAVEIYLLLSAVLFHDIGKGDWKLEKMEQKDPTHAKKSQWLIENRFAVLGIPSRRLAITLGRICHYHDAQGLHEEAHSVLTSRVIGNYGPVRELLLGSLLFLVDRLDSAYTRVMPEYLKSHKEVHVVGAFRRVVNGIRFDHNARMVRVVLGDIDPNPTNPAEITYSLNLEEKDGLIKQLEGLLKSKNPPKGKDLVGLNTLLNKLSMLKEKDSLVKSLRVLVKDVSTLGIKYSRDLNKILNILERFEPKQVLPPHTYSLAVSPSGLYDANGILSPFVQRIQNELLFDQPGLDSTPFPVDIVARTYGFDGQVFKTENSKRVGFKPWDFLLARKVLNAEKTKGQERLWWPATTLVAMVIGDVYKNRLDLDNVRVDLATFGIPISSWLIEYDERLYTDAWKETFEPVLSKDYLSRLAKEMWDLSTQVFGFSSFTYDDLAANMREPDVEKVRMGVRRLAIISKGLGEKLDGKKKDMPPTPILAGANEWKWHVKKTLGENCRFSSLKDVLEEVKGLGEPYERRT